MLCGVKTEAVNAYSLKCVKVVFNYVLYIAVACVEVGHTGFSVDKLVTGGVSPVDRKVAVPVLTCLKVGLDLAVVARKVVCNNVNDNLDAVLVGFRAE